MIKRYDIEPCGDDHCYTETSEHVEGDWVRYEDHAAEVERLRAEVAELESQRDGDQDLGAKVREAVEADEPDDVIVSVIAAHFRGLEDEIDARECPENWRGRAVEVTGLHAEVERLRAEAKRSYECLSVLVYWHDVDGCIDESWFDEAREILVAQKGGDDG